jgi:hypothetical protein
MSSQDSRIELVEGTGLRSWFCIAGIVRIWPTWSRTGHPVLPLGLCGSRAGVR